MQRKRIINLDTNIYDKNLKPIKVGDKVSLFGMTGTVIFECGAYGIGFLNPINWDLIESKIPEITECYNTPCFCCNDNFVSFWELIWNFNCEENMCDVVELVS